MDNGESVIIIVIIIMIIIIISWLIERDFAFWTFIRNMTLNKSGHRDVALPFDFIHFWFG